MMRSSSTSSVTSIASKTTVGNLWLVHSQPSPRNPPRATRTRPSLPALLASPRLPLFRPAPIYAQLPCDVDGLRRRVCVPHSGAFASASTG